MHYFIYESAKNMTVKEITNKKKIVIKVGTSTLTHDTGFLNLHKMEMLAKVISNLHNSGKKIILVSSGSQSAGISKLGLSERPSTREGKQAAAAVGQCELMNMYGRFFAEYGKNVAQVLLTKEVWDDPVQHKNASGTFSQLIEMGCIPIVNENDTISYEGIDFGGNDILAAYVALLSEAELLINLSDIDGLYTKNPRQYPDAKLVERIEKVDDGVLSFAGGAGTQRGTGGMIAKLQSAKLAAMRSIPMIIANGSDPHILYDMIEDGCFTGTYFANTEA